jgi:hypothetical protein
MSFHCYRVLWERKVGGCTIHKQSLLGRVADAGRMSVDAYGLESVENVSGDDPCSNILNHSIRF